MLPTTMVTSAHPKPRPIKLAPASVPTKKAAGTKFGANQTVKARVFDP